VVIWDATSGAEVSSCLVSRWVHALLPFTTGRGETRLAFGGCDTELGIWDPQTCAEVLPRLIPNKGNWGKETVTDLRSWDDAASGRVLLASGAESGLIRVFDCGPVAPREGVLRAANKRG
jgi:WD40 repeat protein